MYFSSPCCTLASRSLSFFDRLPAQQHPGPSLENPYNHSLCYHSISEKFSMIWPKIGCQAELKPQVRVSKKLKKILSSKMHNRWYPVITHLIFAISKLC